MGQEKHIIFIRDLAPETAKSAGNALYGYFKNLGYLQPLVLSFAQGHAAGDNMATALGTILYRYGECYINRDLWKEIWNHDYIVVLFDDQLAEKMFHFFKPL